MDPQVIIGLNAVIVAVTDEVPRILTVQRAEHALAEQNRKAAAEAPSSEPFDTLPFGPFDPGADRTLELGLRRWVSEQTGRALGYVEQLYTFGNRNRDPLEREGGPRVISVAYLALVREGKPSGTGSALWRDWYRFLPWEDRRGELSSAMIERQIAPILDVWIDKAPSEIQRRERRERSDICFGRNKAPWVPERVLDRYELIYEVGLAHELVRDFPAAQPDLPHSRQAADRDSAGHQPIGQPMSLDHRRITASALGRLRGKLKYRPVVFELLPETFTLLQLQRVVEALAGVELHKQNLRRLVEKGGLVEGTGHFEARTGGRPAELFRFRREVLRERPAHGVSLPSRFAELR